MNDDGDLTKRSRGFSGNAPDLNGAVIAAVHRPAIYYLGVSVHASLHGTYLEVVEFLHPWLSHDTSNT